MSQKIKSAFSGSKIYYAVKANSAVPILSKLVKLGSGFDAASLSEIEKCLAAGAEPRSISFGNPIKKLSDIEKAYDLGVRLFAFDSEGELQKLKVVAPEAKVFCRVITNNAGSSWPIDDKFGCSSDMATNLLIDAIKYGLDAYGLSFHVGSQQTNFRQWDKALKRIANIYTRLQKHGIRLKRLNLGGGFPIRYRKDTPEICDLAASIKLFLKREFGSVIPGIMLEPGRFIIGNAGLIRSEVVLVSKKSYNAEKRWVYLDIGRFGGLAETMNEAIQYPLRTSNDNKKNGPVVIAGPSCDGVDVLYRNARYELPLTLEAGDYVDILYAGAYTASYATKEFNGFLPLQEHYI